jgi:hypothetical protein
VEKHYKNAVLDTIKLFDAFAIEAVALADALAVAMATLQPCEELVSSECKMEMIFRPITPDNFEY